MIQTDIHNPNEIYVNHSTYDGYKYLNITGEDDRGHKTKAVIYADKEKMWELATVLLDALMEEELTEADLETMDKASTKLGFYIQDAEVRNGCPTC